MMESSLGIYFYVKNRENRFGKLPIMVRVSVNEKPDVFSPKIYITPGTWNKKYQCVEGKNSEAKEVNNKLKDIHAMLTRIYNKLKVNEDYISAEKVTNIYLGKETDTHTVLEVFSQRLTIKTKLFNSNKLARSTFNRHVLTFQRIEAFIHKEYQRKDIGIKEVDIRFIEGFEAFLYERYKLSRNTAIKLVQIFKSVINWARKRGMIQIDPFDGFSMQLEEVDPDFLTGPELEAIIRLDIEAELDRRWLIDKEKGVRSRRKRRINIERLLYARNLLLFGAFTGMAFSDVLNLKKENLIVGEDGKLCIHKRRQKTKIFSYIPVMDVPKRILELYSNEESGEYLFPRITSVNINRDLKVIADLCGIEKRMHFHVARHTFGTTIGVENDVDDRTLERAMGLTNEKMLRRYARVLNKKVNRDFEDLSLRTKDLQQVYRL